jgi:RNA polymerase sigma factor (sigma-70 family)
MAEHQYKPAERSEEWNPPLLISGFLKGERKSFAELCEHLNRKYHPALKDRFRSSPIAHKIEDVLQDGWQAVFERRESFDPSLGRFDIWAYRIILNCAHRAIERLKRKAGIIESDVLPRGSDSRAATRPESLPSAIFTLDPAARPSAVGDVAVKGRVHDLIAKVTAEVGAPPRGINIFSRLGMFAVEAPREFLDRLGAQEGVVRSTPNRTEEDLLIRPVTPGAVRGNRRVEESDAQ